MPGRDQLIQQNTARAKANAAAPRAQEADGKGSGSFGGPRSFFGGNLEVYSALETIEFQGAAGDASMRGNTAYIRIWKRGNTRQQTQSQLGSAALDLGDNDSQSQISSELQSLLQDPGLYTRQLGFNFFREGFINPYEIGTNVPDFNPNIQIFSQNNSSRQIALGTQTPTNTSSEANSQAPNNVVAFSPTQETYAQRAVVGGVRSANPGGFAGRVANVGRALVGLPQGAPAYVGGANGAGASGPASAALGEMMWQFLFNPSELELEVGPEFKGAETWAVSDKGNSGQPLHWSHNKNPQLKFNSVLLNGFVFGRKVEVLEQGLIELFMARDGVGQHGPHVLEFVWGKRVFGPCVIKNINIKEKMWDEGEVVNAELSFTLEQVPEWTINDGYVDVARPGIRDTVGDVTTPGSSAINPDPGGRTPAPVPEAGAAAGSRNSGTVSTYDQSKCQRAYFWTGNLSKLESSIQNRGFTSRQEADKFLSQMLTMFGTINTELNGFKEYYSTFNAGNFQKSWDALSKNDVLGLFNWEPRRKFLVTSIQTVQNRLGSVWNDPKSCPNTAGKSAKQALSGAARQQQQRPRQVSAPTNLL
jgi:hypothetical protein